MTPRGVTLGFAALLLTGGLINYMDRAVIGLLLPSMAGAFDLSPSQMGWVLTAFSLGYTAFTLVGGWAADRIGPIRLAGLCMASWSLLCGMTGLMWSFASLLVVRFLFGIAESPWFSAFNKTLLRQFPPHRFATFHGLCSMGQPLGGVIAGPAVGFTAAYFGWRTAFFLVAAIGLVWVSIWVLFTRRAGAEDGQARQASAQLEPLPLRTIVRAVTQPGIVGAAVAMGTSAYMLVFFLTWFPSYLSSRFHIGTQELGLITTIPWACSAAGLAVGGLLADWIGSRLGSALAGRRILMTIGLGTAALTVCAVPFLGSPALAVAAMAVTMLFHSASGSTFFAIALEYSEARLFGAVSGFILLTANLMSALAPLVTGYLVEDTHDYTGAFLLAGILPIGGIIWALLGSRTRPPHSPAKALAVASPGH